MSEKIRLKSQLCSLRRVSSLILAAFIILSSFSAWACNKQDPSDNPSEETSSAAENTETSTEEVPDLYVEDYGGYEFTIITRNDDWHTYPLHTRDLFAEEETGDPINDAVYRRNIEIEQMFNIKINMIAYPETTGEGESAPNNALQRALKSNEDIYDLVMSHEINAGSSALAGYFYNWNEVPNVNLSKPWWCQGAIEGLSVGNILPLALSDLSVSSNDHCYVILFNKDLQASYNVENLYEVVNGNKWTFDKMYSIIKDVSNDFDGNGKMDENDVYGLIAGGGQLNFFNAGGNFVAKKDAENRPFIDIVTERSVLTFEKAYDIINGTHTYNFTSWIDEKIVPMFASSKGLLLTTQVGIIGQLRGMDVDFGILPYPKLDEQQAKFYNYVDGHAQLMGIPANKQDIERTGAIIEALSYYSYKYVVPAYYDTNLKTKHARDEESSAMLDYVFDGRVFDFDYVFGNWVISFKFSDQINNKKKEIVSVWEKTLKAAQKQMEKVLKSFDALEE